MAEDQGRALGSRPCGADVPKAQVDALSPVDGGTPVVSTGSLGSSAPLRRTPSGSIGRRKTRHADRRVANRPMLAAVIRQFSPVSPQFDRLSPPFRQMQTVYRAFALTFRLRVLSGAFTHEFIRC